jgi:hypothetical protein
MRNKSWTQRDIEERKLAELVRLQKAKIEFDTSPAGERAFLTGASGVRQKELALTAAHKVLRLTRSDSFAGQ